MVDISHLYKGQSTEEDDDDVAVKLDVSHFTKKKEIKEKIQEKLDKSKKVEKLNPEKKINKSPFEIKEIINSKKDKTKKLFSASFNQEQKVIRPKIDIGEVKQSLKKDYQSYGDTVQDRTILNFPVVEEVEEVETEIKPEIEKEIEEPKVSKTGRKFVIVTSDFCGLGLAIQEKKINYSDVLIAYKPKECEAPETDEEIAGYENMGNGLVDKIHLDEFMAKREDYRDWYIIFDGNHNTPEGEILHQEAFKVIGGTKLCYDLENDREFGINFAEECGLFSPEQKEFKSVEEGLRFLEANPDKAYVYKPNNQDSAYTTVPMTEEPANANIEIQRLIKSLGFSDFLLQEKVKGIEVNLESHYLRGDCVGTFLSLENKRPHNGDLGSACGCCFELIFKVDDNCELAQMTVRKFDNKMKELNYTGGMDANVIIADYNEVHFLEFCGRMGWSFTPNLFFNLASKTCLQYYADLIDGIYETEFKKGFGGSINLFTDHYKFGLPIYVPESLQDKFYLMAGMKDDNIEDDEEHFCISGYGKDIGNIFTHNYTPESTMRECLDNAYKIKFSNIYFRTDVDKKDFPNSPIKRYEALKSMGLI